MKKLGLIGQNIEFSLSPRIYSIISKITAGPEIQYDILNCAPEEFDRGLEKAKSEGYYGVNVTIPYKEKAYRTCQERDENSQKAKSTNVIALSDGKLKGYNSDVEGVMGALKHHERDVKNGRILVLGAGGAARSAIVALSKMGASKVYIINRTAAKIDELIRDLQPQLGGTQVLPFKLNIEDARLDVLINATPLGRVPSESPVDKLIALKDYGVVLDMVYSEDGTRLIKQAYRRGLRGVDGISMLIYQALKAWDIWFQTDICNEEVYEKVRHEFDLGLWK